MTFQKLVFTMIALTNLTDCLTSDSLKLFNWPNDVYGLL